MNKERHNGIPKPPLLRARSPEHPLECKNRIAPEHPLEHKKGGMEGLDSHSGIQKPHLKGALEGQDAVLILSGGMDSVTLLYDYKDSIALAVTFDYGSKHNEKEIAFAKLHCERLGIRHIVIPLSFMEQYFKSSLLKGGEEIPEGRYDDENMKSTVVPFRNGIMLAIATGLAESNGLKFVMMANHSGDHAIYPDCRPQFVDAMNSAISAGTYDGITLRAPYTTLTKGDIAKRGKALGIDYSETWSCYKGGDKHCGKCGTCTERKEALREAGIPDPTDYVSS